MLGTGETLPGDCKLAGGSIERTSVVARYDCSGGRTVAVELRHPSDAPQAATRTERFAIVARGPAPAGFVDAIARRVAAAEAHFRWMAAPPAVAAAPPAAAPSGPPPIGVEAVQGAPAVVFLVAVLAAPLAVVAGVLWSLLAGLGAPPRRGEPFWTERRRRFACYFALFLAVGALGLALVVPRWWMQIDEERDFILSALCAAGKACPLVGNEMNQLRIKLGPLNRYLMTLCQLVTPDPRFVLGLILALHALAAAWLAETGDALLGFPFGLVAGLAFGTNPDPLPDDRGGEQRRLELPVSRRHHRGHAALGARRPLGAGAGDHVPRRRRPATRHQPRPRSPVSARGARLAAAGFDSRAGRLRDRRRRALQPVALLPMGDRRKGLPPRLHLLDGERRAGADGAGLPHRSHPGRPLDRAARPGGGSRAGGGPERAAGPARRGADGAPVPRLAPRGDAARRRSWTERYAVPIVAPGALAAAAGLRALASWMARKERWQRRARLVVRRPRGGMGRRPGVRLPLSAGSAALLRARRGQARPGGADRGDSHVGGARLRRRGPRVARARRVVEPLERRPGIPGRVADRRREQRGIPASTPSSSSASTQPADFHPGSTASSRRRAGCRTCWSATGPSSPP